jgi:hypothetical protein
LVPVAAIDLAAQLGIYACAALASARQAAEVTIRTIGSVRVVARAIVAITDVLCTFLAVVAINVDTQAEALSRVALTRIACGIARQAVLNMRVGATCIGIAGVFGALVAIAAIDAVAKVRAAGATRAARTRTATAPRATTGATCAAAVTARARVTTAPRAAARASRTVSSAVARG